MSRHNPTFHTFELLEVVLATNCFIGENIEGNFHFFELPARQVGRVRIAVGVPHRCLRQGQG